LLLLRRPPRSPSVMSPDILWGFHKNARILVIQVKVYNESANTIDIYSQCCILKTADEGSLFSETFFAPAKVKDLLVRKVNMCVFRTIKTSSYMCILFRDENYKYMLVM
jgi:hypothetical protein